MPLGGRGVWKEEGGINREREGLKNVVLRKKSDKPTMAQNSNERGGRILGASKKKFRGEARVRAKRRS